jgi:hypothetical protein
MRTGIVLTVMGLFVVSLLGVAPGQGAQPGAKPPESPLPSGQQMPVMPGMQNMMSAMQQMMQACLQVMGPMMTMMAPAPPTQPPRAQ